MSRTDLIEPAPAAASNVRPRRPRGAFVIAALAVLWFLIGASGGSYQAKLTDVQKNDNAAWLPKSAQSTKVADQSERFNPVQTIPGFIVYERPSGLTDADKAKITADAATFRGIEGVAADEVGAPVFKGTVASISVPLVGKDHGKAVQGPDLVATEKAIIKAANAGAPAGLAVNSAGPGGLLVAFIDAFSGIDGALLLAAVAVVIVILLIVYRSPVLWIFPLFSSFIALGAAALVIYQLAKHGVLTLNGQSQGILYVLVLGAGTDYALLLISRYREELHNYDSSVDAMIRAWRGAAPPIIASAATVIIGLLCLTLGELNSDRSLGPVCAIGIGCTVIAMLTVLPVYLLVIGRYWAWTNPVGWVLLTMNYRRWRSLEGRWIFWPRVPHVDHQADIATHGWWGRFAAALGRNARRGWVITAAVLAICVIGISGLRSGGLTNTEAFTNPPDAVNGQKLFDRNFSQGEGAPAVIIADAARADAVIDAVKQVPGVAAAPGSVCIGVDYAKLAAVLKSGATAPPAAGCAPQQLRLGAVDGKVLINAQITDRYDTRAASTTIQGIRAAVGTVEGAHALVGGQTAINYDIQQASRHDRNLIIPIVLVVIFVVLALLLRALIAPLLLIATVVLSFTATLGVSAVVFNHLFHFADADPSFPLFAFIFLVALGIDYNIFLMTRVREETLKYGTRDGVLRGLAVTGGVITSAGVVLAATFTVLGVLPLVSLAEIGFAVAFGVLLDTIVVRSILVPALSHDIGRRIWWPSTLARGAE
ncbi:MAG: putative drug exporter of the superfamily [Pseudonocardiales bacterium]|nr:putative drug exporter of the superfamily [Pseudonocardiales bacterium]